MRLSDEHQMIRDMVREFAEAELRPLAPHLDAEERFPAESIPKLAALNLFGLTSPPELGGPGVDGLSYAIALEEVARVCASTALVLATHNSLGVWPILAFGSPEQKQKYVPALARGEQLAAFAMTEADAGSDAAAQRTRAAKRGDTYVIDGTKTCVVNAQHADLYVVSARTDPEPGGPKGLGLFVVERDRTGVVPGDADKDRLGMRGADLGEVRFEQVEVPAANLLGAEDEGYAQCMRALDGARLAIAALAVGLAQGAFECALRYAREREQFGKPIAEHQAIQWRLADMGTEIHAARLLVHDTSRNRDAGDLSPREVAMTKLFATEMATRVCDHAIQIHGGYGYIVEFHVERYYRDAKLCEIAEGTSEVQRLVIARELLREAE
jgi:alkylation response protein AidB-like acyl-CoA dehydrogenase